MINFNFDELIKNNDIIIFTLQGCKPCYDFVNKIVKLLNDKKLRFTIMNVDDIDTAKSLKNIGIKAFPTMIIVEENNLIYYVGNCSEKRLKDILEVHYGM